MDAQIHLCKDQESDHECPAEDLGPCPFCSKKTLIWRFVSQFFSPGLDHIWSRQRSCLERWSIRKEWMAKTKVEISEEFNSDVYEHYRNSVSLYMLLRTEAEKVKREIKINAKEHDSKRMRRDLHDANMVQMFSSRLMANLADITRESFETKKKLGT